DHFRPGAKTMIPGRGSALQPSAPGRHDQLRLDRVSADADHAVVQVGDHARVVGYDPDPLADAERLARLHDDDTVLLAKPLDAAAPARHLPEALRAWPQRIARERLASRVHHRAVGGGDADDGGEHGERAVRGRAGPERDLRAAVVA